MTPNLTSQNGLSLPNTLQRFLSVEHGEEQTQTRFTKNVAGESFIIGVGTDVYVTFINCKATKDHCIYTTKYHTNVLLVAIYEDQTSLNHLQKSTDRFTHTVWVRLWRTLEDFGGLSCFGARGEGAGTPDLNCLFFKVLSFDCGLL